MSVSPRRLMEAVVAAQQAIDGLPEDERLRIDTIEGESELWELLDRIAVCAIADKQLAELAAERAARFKARGERHRNVILRILAAVGITEPLERPLYTASLRHTQHARITDASAIPTAFLRTAPDMRLIEQQLRADTAIPGAVLSNPEPTLTLRVK